MGTYEDIRASVRALAAGFPGESWRALDRERGYPTAFVQAMTKAGFLSVLIPESYGGSGLGIGAAARRAGPRPTWRHCSPRTGHGRPPTYACRPTFGDDLAEALSRLFMI